MTESLKITHLNSWHKKRAKMVEFAGYEMPLWYDKGIVEEHLAVRKSVGVFDVTHMGRFLFTGSEAEDLLDYLTTNDVKSLKTGEGQYSVLCNEKGGIIDDLIIYRLEEKKFFVIVNSANKIKDENWFREHAKGRNVEIRNISDTTPQFAVQGPKAIESLNKISEVNLNRPYKFGEIIETKLAGYEVYATRTGYTGEDGYEISQLNVPLSNPKAAVDLWEKILEAGSEFGITPVGLGARDTLRLEAGMPLHGSDITEETTPLEARLKFVVKFDKKDFIGKEALIEQNERKPSKLRVGLIMIDKGIPRAHLPIYGAGRLIGETTSGSYSPLLPKGYGVALGYVSREFKQEGAIVYVEVHGKKRPAEVVKPRKMLKRIREKASQLQQA
ncbi:MAG: glycine cleavage system aminomethyltransferase GcvT [Candidatus Odinarchaeum yellowstonii]|uniref:Probable aminomethyltransferase n=1 Tax=Odinarchaeota yellowstonii (strain LCB_4) TaxID=1841599 RepID=A0AAF0D3B4_ODILC|nr:MAG: glycine cleavage system aminomethyltransferase GcvT [Candidatus Odinarchaeum yellowstonii]